MKSWFISDAEDKITQEAILGSATNLVPEGSILVVNRSGILKRTLPVGVARRPVAINQDIKALICGPMAHPDYIAHIVKAAEPTVLGWVRATTADNFPVESLRGLEIPLPPLDEQRRIAAILDKADALRQKRKRAIALLDSLMQSIFLEMFGDPVLNPKGLPKKSLQDLIRVKSGDGLTSAQMDKTGEYLVYGGNGPNGRHSRYMFEEPVVTIGRVGVYCGAVHITEPKSWVTDNSLYVADRADHLELDYLAAALKIANLNQYAGRAAQPLISGGRIYPVEILAPPVALQQRYAAAIAQLRLVQGTASLDSIETLFASLQHRAFSGQL